MMCFFSYHNTIICNEVCNEVFPKSHIFCYYSLSDGQQNAPLIQFFYIPQRKVLKKEQEVLQEVKSSILRTFMSDISQTDLDVL